MDALPAAARQRAATRILWVIDSLAMGGAEALVPVFADAADGASLNLEVCYLKEIGGNPIEPELRQRGIVLHHLGARNLRDLRAFRKLLGVVRQSRPHVVHAHLTYSCIWSALACRWTDTPLVASLHVPPASSRWSRDGIRQRLMCALLRRYAHTVIAVSNAQREEYLRAGLLPANRVQVVHNGVRGTAGDFADRELVRQALGVPAGALALVTVSVLREQRKGIPYLLDAVGRLQADGVNVHLLIAGDGPLRPELESLASALNLSASVRFLGARRDVPSILQAADAFVLPTLKDPFPTVLLEAMAAGLPVISTRVGGVPEIVEHGRTGLLVDPADAAALARAIGALANRETRRRFGEAGRQRLDAYFSQNAWAAQLHDAYSAAARSRTFTGTPDPGPTQIAVVEPASRGGLIHYALQLADALAANGSKVSLVTDRHFELSLVPCRCRVEPVLRLWDPKPPGVVSLHPASRLARRARRLWRGVQYQREWFRLLIHLRRLAPEVVLFGDLRFPLDVAWLKILRVAGFRLADICHNVHPFAMRGGDLLRHSAVDRALLRSAYRQFDHVFVHYQSNRTALMNAFDLAPDRISTIEHGHEQLFERLRSPAFTAAALRQSLEVLPADPVVLLFGTLTRYKGVDVLLRAWPDILQCVPDARLVLAGFPAADFDLKAHERLADDLGVTHSVRFVPRYLETPEVGAWMDLATVAVFPYRAGFQSGAVAVAQTFGLPVVVSSVGALDQMVSNGDAGLVVSPGEPRELADAIVRLLNDPALRQRLGEAGRAERCRAGDWNAIARQVLDRLFPAGHPVAEMAPSSAEATR